MAGFLEQVGNVARDAVQGLACGVENYQDFVRRLNPLGDIVPPPPSLWPLLCPDRPPPPELFPQQPFSGGQCPGVTYRIEGLETFQRSAGNPDGVWALVGNGTRNVLGPVGNFRFQTQNDFGFRQVLLSTGAGEIFIRNPPTDSVGYDQARFSAIVRVDGQPDDCGDPPPVIPIPPTPLPPLPPEDRPVTDPDGGPDIDFTFAPRIGPIFIDAGGGLFVPVEVNISGPNIFAPINVPVNISLPDFAPTFNIGGGGGGGGGEPGPPEVPCCDPPERPGPTEEGEEDEPVEVEPDEEGGRLFGVRVESVVNASRASATRVGLADNSPELWVPRIATVVFELVSQDAEGNTITSTSGDFNVKTTNQLVLAPDGVTVSRVFVTPSKGVQTSVTPIYKRAS